MESLRFRSSLRELSDELNVKRLSHMAHWVTVIECSKFKEKMHADHYQSSDITTGFIRTGFTSYEKGLGSSLVWNKLIR